MLTGYQVNFKTAVSEEKLQLAVVNNRLLTTPQQKLKQINNIHSCSCVFVNYAIICNQRHYNRAPELLKYHMSIIKEIASVNPFHKCEV